MTREGCRRATAGTTPQDDARVDAQDATGLCLPPSRPEVRKLKRAFAILLIVSGLAGIGFEIYEVTFSLYLKHLGVPGRQMGVIYAVAGVATVIVRIYLGHLSDRWGRKGIYASSMACYGLACFLTPGVSAGMGLNVLKSVRDGADYVRQVMHSLFLFDHDRGNFKRLIANTRGFEVIFQGLGALTAGWLIWKFGYRTPMLVAALAVLVGAVLLLVGLPKDRVDGASRSRLSLRCLLALDMPPTLRLITARQFVFMIGLSASHCFIMQQWFVGKFGVSEATVGLIMAIHRFSFGVPLVLAGMLPLRRLRLAAAIAILLQGLATGSATLFPNLILATPVWLSHDIFGAAIWNPIHAEWVQRYSNQEVRGRQTSQSETIAFLGAAIGPLIAGECVRVGWIDGPFLLAGAIIALSAVPIAWMPRSADAEIHRAEVGSIPAEKPVLGVKTGTTD